MKRVLSILIAVIMAIPVFSLPAYAEAGNSGTPTAEINTGDMNRVPYNNPNITVDLDAGTWAQPAVMDLNGDGNLDLVVSGTAVCYNGTYVFYGHDSSGNDLVMDKGLRLTNGAGNFFPTYTYDQTFDAQTGKYGYTYKDTLIFSTSTKYPDFKNTFYQNGINLNTGLTWPNTVNGAPFNTSRANEYTLVDFDGDGRQDLVRGVENWDEYGWAGKFDSSGHWGDQNSDPLHGWVFWS